MNIDFRAFKIVAAIFLISGLFATGDLAYAKKKRVKGKQAIAATDSKKKVDAKPAEKLKLPSEFVDERVTKVLRELKGRPPRLRSAQQVVSIKTPIWSTKSQWLNSIYGRGLVDNSKATGFLSDKLLFYEIAKRELGPNADRYLVKTVGLRDFLVRQGLVDSVGRLVADGDLIESKLYEAFPTGFVARPAVGVAPRETGSGLFRDSDGFVAELVQADTFLYRPDHIKRPVRSTVLDEIASGEAVVLQEDILAKRAVELGARASDAKRAWREVRVHTYEGRVVADAKPNFWVRDDKLSDEEIFSAQKFVAEFLRQLSPQLLIRQAWSIDVLLLDDAVQAVPGRKVVEMKIADIITNRGRRGGWSGYLDQPRVIGAYTRHFEAHAGVKFVGLGGQVLRRNAGNYFSYWGLRIDRSRPGLDKVLAWIPPWP
ncbi:MAG: hypothetical protein U1E10_14660 [Bdellovibrionales bacterium]|nr:hypothetical protein [Bdellovibrionales bacterium]